MVSSFPIKHVAVMNRRTVTRQLPHHPAAQHIQQYARIALSPLLMHTMDKLERFQRKAARVCLRLPLYTPADHSHLLRRLSLSSLHCSRNIKHLLLAHSIHHRYAPLHILQLNLPPPTTPNYSLRHRRSYHVPSSRTDRHKDSPYM